MSWEFAGRFYDKNRPFFDYPYKDYSFKVDLENGDLLISRKIVNFNGKHLPLELSLNYYRLHNISNDLFHNQTGLPRGFKTNYHIFLEYVSDYDKYYYEDMDGFLHVFSLAVNSVNLYYDSFGTGLMLIKLGNTYKVFDEDGNYQLFDSLGRLTTIHKKITSTHYAEQTITYASSDALKIETITDNYGRVVSFSYTSSSVTITYNNVTFFTITMNNSYNITKIVKNIGDNHLVEDDYIQSTYLDSITLAGDITFDFTYSNSKLYSVYTNIELEAYWFNYDSINKRTTVNTSRNTSTTYDYNHQNKRAQSSNGGIELNYQTITSSINAFLIRGDSSNNLDSIHFNLANDINNPIYQNVNFSSNSINNVLANNINNNILSKKFYLFYVEISGNLASDSFEVSLLDYDNHLLASLTFTNKDTLLAAPVGVRTSSLRNFHLKVSNHAPNNIMIKNAYLIPLVGSFSLLTSNTDTGGPILYYDNTPYYILNEGVGLTFSTPISNSYTYRMKISDYVINEKLLYLSQGIFRFWVNDKTLLIDGITEASIMMPNNKELIFNGLTYGIYYEIPNDDPLDTELYRLIGKDDCSLKVTKFSHNSASFYISSSYFYEEKETKFFNDISSVTTYYDYDINESLKEINRQDGYKEEYSYDNNANLLNKVTSHTSLNKQKKVIFEYDQLDNMTLEKHLVSTSFEEVSFSYYSGGKINTISYPNLHDEKYNYDVITSERCTRVKYYDLNNNEIEQYNNFIDDDNASLSISGNTYSYEYEEGELIAISYNNQELISIEYDPDIYNNYVIYNKHHYYYANNYNYDISYDVFNRPHVIEDLLFETYDDYNNVLTIRDYSLSNNQCTLYEYDYYSLKTKTTIEHNHLSDEFVYDVSHRLINQTFKDNNVDIYSLDYQYHTEPGLDKVINQTSIQYGSSLIDIEDEVDGFSRITKLKTTLFDNSFSLRFEYNVGGTNNAFTNNLIKKAYYEEETYSPFGPTPSFLNTYDLYNYDEVGNITSVTRYIGNMIQYQIDYVYDAFSRLIRENNPLLNKTITYSYDNNGNILSKMTYAYSTSSNLVNPILSYSYIYSQTYPNRLTSYNNESCSYDNVGNPTTYRGKSLTWTKGTLLSQLVDGLTTITLTYDGFKQRISKSVDNDVTTYSYIDNLLIKEVRSGVEIKYLYSHRGVIGFIKTGQFIFDEIYFYEKNAQQDVIAIRDVNNNIVNKYVYDAFGNHKVLLPNDMEDDDPFSIGHINPIRYRSYYYDADLKMYWLTTRHYDPEVGRFISPDHYSYLDYKKLHGLNLYAYSKNNPVMYYDPSGHFTLIFLLLASAAVIGAAAAATAAYDFGRVSYLESEENADSANKHPTLTNEEKKEFKETFKGDGFTIYYKIATDNDDPWNTLTVFDSWRYSEEERIIFLNYLKTKYSSVNVDRMSNEWAWHNLSYHLGIGVLSAKNADIHFNAPDERFWLIFEPFGFW